METEFRLGEWFIQPEMGTVTREDKSVSLEPKVMEVLLYLVKHQGQVLPKNGIIEEVWKDTFVGDGVLVHAISELRKAFEDDPHDPSVIETLPKRGYRLIAPVVETDRLRPNEYELPKTAQRRWIVILPILGAIVAAAVWWLFFTTKLPRAAPGEITSLAVLPLVDLSEREENEYFVAGMTDALISELGKISALRVISRQSVLKYKKTDLSLPEIADELKVDAIVAGSVFREGSRVRIAAQLIEAYPERHVWSESYDRDLSGILALQSEVAQALAKEIRTFVTPDEQVRLARTQAVNPEAYEAYLKGKYHWEKWTLKGVRKSTEYFQQAIAMDPDFAPSWAELAFSYRFPSVLGQIPGRVALPRAKKAALRAVDLDPALAETHAILGTNDCFERNWVDGERKILTALSLNPSYAHGHHMYSNLNLAPQGRLDEALREIQRARELAPLSLPHNAVQGKIHYLRREYGRAINQLRDAADLNPNFGMTYLYIGKAYRQIGMCEEAITAHQKAISLSKVNWFLGELGYTSAVCGKRTEAFDLVEDLLRQSKSEYVSAHAIALIYTGLGETDLAFEWLEKANREMNLELIWIKVDPAYDRIREDPRFKALLRRMNLEP